MRDEVPSLGAQANLPVLKIPSERLPAPDDVLRQALLEGEDLPQHILGGGESHWRSGLGFQRGDGVAFIPRLCLQVAQHLHHRVGVIAVGDEADEALDARLGAGQARVSLLDLGTLGALGEGEALDESLPRVGETLRRREASTQR